MLSGTWRAITVTAPVIHLKGKPKAVLGARMIPICRRRDRDTLRFTSNEAKVTCKNCLRRMGLK